MNAQLNKKLGPLKMWHWLVIGAVVIVVAMYLRRRSDAAGTTAGDYEPGDSLSGYAYEEEPIAGTAGGGAGGFGAGGVSTPPDNVLFTDGQQSYDGYGYGYGGFPTGGGLMDFDPSLRLPPFTIYEPTWPVTTQEAAHSPPVSAPPKTTETFMFYGRSWARKDKTAFIAALKLHGSNYAQWKGSHQPAACRVFGDC